MKKDFQRWHKKKTEVDAIPNRPFFHEREIWWAALGANVGFEQDGKGEKFARPVLVFKKFSKEVFWALPLTLQNKANKKTAHFYAFVDMGDKIRRFAILSQLRLVDARRLLKKIGFINRENYADIQKAVIRLCGL